MQLVFFRKQQPANVMVKYAPHTAFTSIFKGESNEHVKIIMCSIITDKHYYQQLDKTNKTNIIAGAASLHWGSWQTASRWWSGTTGQDSRVENVLHTLSHDLFMNNVLHLPQAKKNLVSVHRFTSDNNEFHPNFFLVKEQETKKTILRGQCEVGLYPLPSSSSNGAGRHDWSATKPLVETGHKRLGHPSSPTVHQVISQNKLPCPPSVYSHESVCDACQ